jgi:metal-responsive CopG/Arc/MetJ family transcriptional regulator
MAIKNTTEEEEEKPVKQKVAVTIDKNICEKIDHIVEKRKTKGMVSSFSGMVNILLKYGLIYRDNKQEIEEFLNKQKEGGSQN